MARRTGLLAAESAIQTLCAKTSKSLKCWEKCRLKRRINSVKPSSSFESGGVLNEDILEKAVQENSVEVSDGTEKEYRRCVKN